MKKYLFSCIIIFLGATSIYAEGGSVPESTTSSIEILVVDGNTEEPIPAAKVIINGQSSETYTDLDGMAKFESLGSGEYDIEISFVSYEKYSLKSLKIEHSVTQLLVKLYP